MTYSMRCLNMKSSVVLSITSREFNINAPRTVLYVLCLPERQHSPVYIIARCWGALKNKSPLAMCEDGSRPEIMSLPASMRDTWRRYFNWRPLFKWAGLAFVLWEVLCRGLAWLSRWLDPLTHTHCSSSNTLSPLPDYFASLMWCMASQLATPAAILVSCAIVFATSLTLFLLDLSRDQPAFKFQLRCRPATQPPAPPLPAFTTLWVLGVTLSTASGDTTVSFRRLLFHLPEPDAELLV